MENSKGSSTMRTMYSGKNYSLPPKSPFPSVAPFYADYAPTAAIVPKGIPKYRDGNSHHQRTSSESLLIEEQPSWLDELLDEPETPVQRGHRRSSSDSFTYMEAANANIERAAQNEYRLRNMTSAPSWGSRDFDPYKDVRNASFYAERNPMTRYKNRAWDSPQNALAHSSGTTSSRDSFIPQNPTSSGTSQEVNGITLTTTEKQDAVESCLQDANTSSERNDSSNPKASASETDTKRAKQQFAQRSRVRKLQYIAELERNVQALQTEGSEVSAELKFLNQQSLILNMENKALKQRLENLAQEQLIKYFEHEVLEREIGRLRALYKQQQQPPPEQPLPSHRRTNSRDKVESQFANLSLKNKESGAVPNAVSSPLHI